MNRKKMLIKLFFNRFIETKKTREIRRQNRQLRIKTIKLLERNLETPLSMRR